MYRIIGYFALIEVAGLLGFIVASWYLEGMLSRFSPLLVALVAIGFIAYLKARAFSYKEIAYISMLTSMTFILVSQLLGFTIFPGLAKDMKFFSGDNAVRVGLMFIIGTVGHFLVFILGRVSQFSEA